MAGPNLQTIEVVRGDDDDKLIAFSIEVANFADAWFTIREGWRENENDDGGVVFQARLSNGGIQAYSSNTLLLPLPHDQTTTWGFDAYVYDVQVLTTAGKVITTQRGTLRMTPDVTASVA
ncbi:hypothetical protein [Caudoviricetes sp.]|nr:hypothetical protein [Caudoviricetes sp.]